MSIQVEQPYQNISGLLASMSISPSEPHKSVFRRAMCLSTPESVEGAKGLLEQIKKIRESLPVEREGFDVALAQKNLNTLNAQLLQVNGFIDFIDMLFDKFNEVNLDDDNISSLIPLMKSVQLNMQYISNYLCAAIEFNSDASDHQIYSVEELVAIIAPAA